MRVLLVCACDITAHGEVRPKKDDLQKYFYKEASLLLSVLL